MARIYSVPEGQPYFDDLTANGTCSRVAHVGCDLVGACLSALRRRHIGMRGGLGAGRGRRSDGARRREMMLMWALTGWRLTVLRSYRGAPFATGLLEAAKRRRNMQMLFLGIS